MARLERTACLGNCPMYKLTVFSDGQVEFVGEQFVKVKGKAQGQLTPQQLKALQDAFRDSGYFDLKGNFGCYEMTDHPWAHTEYSDGARRRKIEHYHGCGSVKQGATLTKLEDQIDQITNSVRWLGTESERDQNRGKW